MSTPLVAAARRHRPRLIAELAWRRRRRTLAGRILTQLVPRGGVVLDIGASEGVYAAGLLKLVGTTGCVHAFEPNPAVARHLYRFEASQLHVHEAALSNRDGTATLRVPIRGDDERTGLGTLELPDAKRRTSIRAMEVPVRRLDDLFSDLERLDFVKCDVEGHERAVLAGGRALLERFLPPMLIEVEQRHQSAPIADVFRFLEQLGYRGWALFAGGLRPLEAFDLRRDQLRHVRDDALFEAAPEGYVSDFLFVVPDTRADAVTAHSSGS